MVELHGAQNRPRTAVLVAPPAAAAALLLLHLTPSGLALTSDSVQYLAAGKNFAAGGPLVTVGEEPFVLWPPLLPAVIAVLAAAGPLLDLLRVLHAILYGAVVAVAGWFLYRTTNRALTAVCGAALLAAHPWFGFVHAHLWSEPLFLLWTMLALFSVHSPWRFGVFTALAILTRYAALSLVPVGLAVFLLDGSRPPRERVRRAALSTTFGLAALGVVAIHNWLASGAALPPHPPAVETLAGAAGSLARELIEATLPWRIATALTPAWWALALLAGWLAALVTSLRSSCVPAAAVLLWIGTYAGLLILTSSQAAIDPMGPRLLAPILMGGALALLLVAPPFPAALLLAGVLAVGVVHEGRLWRQVRHDPPDSLRTFARRTMGAPGATRLVSNFPEAAYLMTGRFASISPRRTAYGSDQDISESDLLRLSRVASAESTALIWFHVRTSPRLLSLDRLAERVELAPLRATPEVAVFAVRPLQPVVGRPEEGATPGENHQEGASMRR